MRDGILPAGYEPPMPVNNYKMEPDAATLAAAEEEAQNPKKWPDPPPPNPDAPQGDPDVRFDWVDPDTGKITPNLTADEVFELEEKWRADYDARVQAKIEADAASFVPEPFEEDE